MIDLLSENTNAPIEVLYELVNKKTACLIKAACELGCLAANASDAQKNAASVYGESVGVAGRVRPDIADEYLAHKPVWLAELNLDAVRRLRELDPDCIVEILNGSQQALISLAEQGQLDFFICTSTRLPEVFETIPLNRERLYLCLPASLPINEHLQDYQTGPGESGECFDFSLLNGYPFIFLGENQPLQKNIGRFLEEYKITSVSRTRVNQVATGLELVAAGEGVFMASTAAIRSCASRDAICTYALPESYTDRQIYAACNRHHALSDACLKMLSLLKEE